MLEQDSQKMKWKLALRIATSPSERWLKKAAEWNPELSSRYRTNRAIGILRKRWGDNRNDFLSQRPQKMGSARRNLHNDRGRTREDEKKRKKPKPTSDILRWSEIEWRRNSQHHIIKEIWDDDYGKRSSSAITLRMHQQADAFESSSRLAFKNFAMGWRLKVKNNVTSSPQRMKILSTTSSYQNKIIWLGNRSDWWATVPAYFLFGCVFCPGFPGLLVPSWFPWLLRCVAQNPKIPAIWIREQAPARACVSLHVLSSSSHDLIYCTLSLPVG